MCGEGRGKGNGGGGGREGEGEGREEGRGEILMLVKIQQPTLTKGFKNIHAVV